MEGITILENLCLVVLVGNIAIAVLSFILGRRRGRNCGYDEGYVDGAVDVHNGQEELNYFSRQEEWEAGKYNHG